MSLPELDVGSSCEPFEPYTRPEACEGDTVPEAQVGVKAFRDFVVAYSGGGDSGIVRACNIGNPSHHKEGRAWDWTVNANSPDDVARVQELFDWLFAMDRYGNDAAIFRRVGLVSVIWNGQHWSTAEPSWRPYTGANRHTDHVHFSFGWPGARAQTSFYRWLGMPLPPPNPIKPGSPLVVQNMNWVGLLAIVGMLGWLTRKLWWKRVWRKA